MAACMLACEELMAWHEGNRVDYVYMPARNDRLCSAITTIYRLDVWVHGEGGRTNADR
jgi:hypothetical protein